MEDGEEEKRMAMRARVERMRAERRRRIGENAQHRMERVKGLQQRFAVTEEIKPEPVEEKMNNVEAEKIGVIPESITNNSTSDVEDPPDELVKLPEQQTPVISPLAPSSSPPPKPSLLGWLSCSLQTTKLVRLISSSLIPLLWILTAYSLPFFLLWFTCELALCLAVLVVVRTSRDIPNQPQLQGTLAIVKAAVGLMYPGAVNKIEFFHQLFVVALCLMQDLCVSVFVLVTIATISDHFFS